MKKRYLSQSITSDLKEKMVLVAGPRQVGKTTLAKYVGKQNFPSFAYFNWDYQPDRKNIVNIQFPGDTELLIFDELHKYKHWKNYLKGLYDKYKEIFHILVTGSAKLDIYRKGGDSLMGRYFHYILHPFSLAELSEVHNKTLPFKNLSFTSSGSSEETFKSLLHFGPFPEPFLKQNTTYWRRWQIERNDRLITEDIRNLRMIGDISILQILVDMLSSKTASLLSVNNISNDLQIAHKTAVNYLNILELFYFHFRIYPFTKKPLRSLKKMSKLYLWDWSPIIDTGAKFENMIASHLLKFIHYLQNTQGYKAQLYYLRDPEGREVDFLIAVDNQPWFAVETKLDSFKVSQPLLYFNKKLQIPFLFQVVKESNIDQFREGVRIISADKFLSGLV